MRGYAAAPNLDTTALEPESRLMLAVLEEALISFQRGVVSEVPDFRTHYCAVDRWVASRDIDWPFSFENICTTLRLDPQYIRQGLRELKMQARQRSVAIKQRKVRRERCLPAARL